MSKGEQGEMAYKGCPDGADYQSLNVVDVKDDWTIARTITETFM
jgi:hypothetical protein